jgi:uncharacterized membrane protein YgdD (TMEM256/DUF423 family)
MKQNKSLVALAALSGGLAVAAGAFGAHGASGAAVGWLRTGAEYQLIHAIAAMAALSLPRGRLAAILFLLGSLLFAGSLYAMALGAPHRWGIVTPIGGASFIIGWVVLALAALR